ncbi:MAG TPA: ATP-binding protein, partial [Pseudonocardia sp.]
SAVRTAEAVARLAGPAAELARRGSPPVLRLVWPSAEQPPAGFATEVRLPLRAGLDGAALLDHARAAAPDLLLALPALVEIDVAGQVVRRTEADGVVTVGARRWRVVRRTGLHDGFDGAVEQRDRREWSVTWALPLDGRLGDDVAHAPTATAEALAVPARLIATLPLEPDRRRVRPGPAADAVLDGAAAAYVDLVRAVDPGGRLALVPEPGFPRSPLDGQLRARIVAALRTAAWLPAAASADRGGAPMGEAGLLGVGRGGAGLTQALPRELVPGRAEWLDIPGLDVPGPGSRLTGLLAAAGFDRLAAPPYLPAALTELGARRVTAAELVERLFGVERPPSWWRAVYVELADLADTVPGLVDDLRALPVPLVDGRAAAGPATVLLPEPSSAAPELDGSARLALPGLHVAHPDAVHLLLTRLGATPADPTVLLDHPALRTAVERSVDDADAGLDPAPLAEAVLALVEAAGARPTALGALALPDEEGRPTRADELMLPDAVLRPLLADDVPVGVLDPGWATRFPRDVLTAVGVLDGFALVVDEEPVRPDHDLDDEDRWWDSLAEPPSRLVAVRDLDLVDDEAWQAALAILAADRALREAATSGYTAWWLARHARLGGRRPGRWRLPSAVGIAALYDPVPPAGSPRPDDAFLGVLGVRRDLHIADARAADDLLARLADPGRHPSAALAASAHIALAEAVADGRVDAAELDLPEHVRAMDGAIAHVDVAAVLDAPWPAPVLPASELVIGGDPVALAELLDLPLASDIVAGEIEGDGEPVAWADLGEIVVTCHTLGVDVPDGGLRRHPQLWVALRRPQAGRHRVPVWRDGSGGWHAEDPLRALLALLAE